MMLYQMSSFYQRLFVSFILTLLLAFAITYSHHTIFYPFFVLFFSGGISIALWEFYQIAKKAGIRDRNQQDAVKTAYQPFVWPAIFVNFLYLFLSGMTNQFPIGNILNKIILIGSLFFLFLYCFMGLAKRRDSSLINLSLTVFGIAYLTLPLSYLLSINYLPLSEPAQDGRLWLFYLLVVAKTSDMGGFFIGKLWGSRPLASSISPKKTIEGALGGLIFSISFSILFHLGSLFFSLHLFSLTFYESLFLGFGIAILAQIGDLAESLLKRDAGVKDSNQLPGLGGMLDIVDSMVFSAPFLYFYLMLRG